MVALLEIKGRIIRYIGVVVLGICIPALLYVFLAEDTHHTKQHVDVSYPNLPHQQRAKVNYMPRNLPLARPTIAAVLKFKPKPKSTMPNVQSKGYVIPIDSVPRAERYCNVDKTLGTGAEGDVPAGYELELVHTVIRHGDRSPMYNFLEHPNPDFNCQFDSSPLRDNPRLAAFIPTLMAYKGKQRPGSGFLYFALYPSNAKCIGTQLTGTGALQHLYIGEHLNRIYVHKWQLFGRVFSPSQIHIRSTEYSRTYQSAIALLYGLLPSFNLTDLNVERSTSLLFCSGAYSRHSCQCPILQVLKQISDQFSGTIAKNSSRNASLRRRIASVYSLKPGQLLWAWAMMDIFNAHICHQRELPCNIAHQCIDQSIIADLWSELDYLGSMQVTTDKVYDKYSRLLVQPLLAEMARRMINVTIGNTVVKFVLYSGHDTSLRPMLAVFGIGEGRWPSYASRIVIELYSRKKLGKKLYYIKVIYNGEDKTRLVKFCKNINNDGLCKLSDFLDFVSKENMKAINVINYEKACYNTV